MKLYIVGITTGCLQVHFKNITCGDSNRKGRSVTLQLITEEKDNSCGNGK